MAAPLGLTIRSTLVDMQIGDCIPCRYTSLTSGVAGYFSELGTCTASEIPLSGTATPNGLFYFIKVAKGLLIADRVIQTNISWDVLNTAKFIEGVPLKSTLIPNMTANNAPIPFVLSSSGVYTTHYEWYACSSVANGNDKIWYVYTQGTTGSPNPVGGHWFKIDMGSIQTFNTIQLQAALASTGHYSIEDFEIYISNNDVDYTKIYNNTHPNDSNVHEYILPTVSARYMRINILNSYYSTVQMAIGINKIQLIMDYRALVRSLSGGCAYADSSGNSSITDKSLGGWPICNEWDTYIVKSTLGGKITAGDNNIWHWSGIYSLCRETPILGISTNVQRITRGYNLLTKFSNYNSSSLTTNVGPRPALEYIEPDGSSKQSNLWY